MIKRFLLLLLIVCTLGYGSAWAFDNHFDSAEEHQIVNGDTDNLQDADGDSPCCNDSCHSSAHLVGLSSYQSGPVYPGAGTGNTPCRQSLAFLATAPPLRPPQV